jgi:hypothetical protein
LRTHPPTHSYGNQSLQRQFDGLLLMGIVMPETCHATKPNPFKIISLQPTRKENNWETEETMERARVTLGTERAKWPNPRCL